MELQSTYLQNKRDMVVADNPSIRACVQLVSSEMAFVVRSKRADDMAPGMALYAHATENKFAWIFSKNREDRTVGWMDMDTGEEFRIGENSLGVKSHDEKQIDKMDLPKLREFYSL